jgi:hypothetical protein
MKKLFLILSISTLLALSLGLGQVALAEDVCATPPANDAECTANEGYSCIDTLLPGFNVANFTCDKPCKCTDLTTPTPTNKKCCKPKAAATDNTCKDPNTCKTVDACPGTPVGYRVADQKCPEILGQASQVCCKPPCLQCVDTATGCTGNYTKADSSKFQPCGTGKICCQMASGAKGGGGGGTGSTQVDLPNSGLNPVGNIGIPDLIGYIIKGALGVIGSLALIIFIYGGLIMMISQGDPTKIQKGKGAMVWASVGLIVIFGSYIFVTYLINSLERTGDNTGGETSCGQGAYAGYSCRTKTDALICVTGLCPGGVENQCCKPK